MKKRYLILCLIVSLWMMGAASTVHAEDTKDLTSEESYTTRSMLELYQENALTFEGSAANASVTFEENADANGVLVTAAAGVMESGRFQIGKKFHFDGKCVERVGVNALAGKGESLKLHLYLDDETESFATIAITDQGRSDVWTKDICLQADVLGKNITGEHTISFTITSNSNGKEKVFLRSIEFVESSDIPTIYLNLDESLGTIEEMNLSKDGSKECYGDMSTQTSSGESASYELNYLKGYANADLTQNKKSYELKLESQSGILGLKSCQKWLLLSNTLDNSKLKNQLSYSLGQELSLKESPAYTPVNLVMNGVYYGSYLLAEEITHEADQINIAGLSEKDIASYTSSMDWNSAIDYYWMQEISMNPNGFLAKNNYIYKDESGIVYFGPIGDLEQAWSCSKKMTSVEGFYFQKNECLKYLMKDAAFINQLVERWPDFRDKLLEACEDGGSLDQYYDQYSTSVRYDVEKWGFLKRSDDNTDDYEKTDDTSLLKEKEELKSWIRSRITWIDSNVYILKRETCKLKYLVDGKLYRTVSITSNVNIGSVLTAPSKTGYLFAGWRICDEAGNITGGYVYGDSKFSKDTVIKAVYVSSKGRIAPKQLYLSAYSLYIPSKGENSEDDSAATYHLYFSVYPAGAYGTVHFVSSNEEVVTVSQKGIITMIGKGDATITVTYGTLKRTCKVHVYDSDDGDVEYEIPTLSKTSLTLKKGQCAQLSLKYSSSVHQYYGCQWVSTDESVVSVSQCGLVTAKKNGTAYIYTLGMNDDEINKCKVTVGESTIKKGSTYVYKGIKYKVTYKAKKGGNVKVIGPTKKTLKSCTIPSTVKIKGETYKVKAISAKAFYKCKKLRKIKLGKNIRTIGTKAFAKIYKKAVFKVPSSKKKYYKKLLTKKKGFKKTMKVR